MSKIIDELLPEDFGKSFDAQLFEGWKQSMEKQKKASFVIIAMQVAALITIILLGGIIGLALFFAMLITAMIIAISKRRAVKQYQDQLGFTNAEFRKAFAIRRKKIKQEEQN